MYTDEPRVLFSPMVYRAILISISLCFTYRDEHMDFVDEMRRLRVLRGKKYRVKGGGGGKRSSLSQ